MAVAYVLINTETGFEADVLKLLKKLEGVEEVFAVYGVYDVILKVRATSMDKLNEIVTSHIRSIDRVRSTLTMPVIDDSK